MNARFLSVLAALVLILTLNGPASAELFVRGTGTITSSGEGSGGIFQLIYDTELDITWLDYTKNDATWSDQIGWAANLVVDSSGVNLSDWRLPETFEDQANLAGGFGYAGPDGSGYHDYRYGYNMVNSEMGHLFFETLGNLAYYAKDGTNPQPGFGLSNTGVFDNLSAYSHWSATGDAGNAWCFTFLHGAQYYVASSGVRYALAVHPGDVAAPTATPVSPSVWLLGSGLVALLGWRRVFRRWP